jgi:hypothetical protein
LAHSDSEIVLVPYDEAYEEGFEDMPRRVPDTSKINHLVGFKPEMKLEGITRNCNQLTPRPAKLSRRVTLFAGFFALAARLCFDFSHSNRS